MNAATPGCHLRPSHPGLPRNHRRWSLRSLWRSFHGKALIRLLVLAIGALAPTVFAAESEIELEPIKPNLRDKPSLQRGMALYMNYCIACHSLQFQRYERTADDLGIPHQVALDNLVFTGQAIGGLMETSMAPSSAKNWFGAPPPDLTMVDRVRGTAWVYSMLKNFYVDESRPFGVNNRVYPNIGMPHVLIGLQGVPKVKENAYRPLNILDGESVLVRGDEGMVYSAADGHDRERVKNTLEVEPGTGSMAAEEFDQAAYDIANFLHYVGDPGRLERYRIGYWVLGFLAVLFVFATLLNREYWKDVH